MPSSSLKRFLLVAFGARMGKGAVIKPGVRVKNPWLLSVGRNCWLGEDCWIDNLVPVSIGDSVCLSQGSYLCTGNHDWSDPSFRYRLAPITLQNCSWVGARTLVGPGVTLGTGAVLTAGSTAYKSIPDWEIYSGCPAAFVKMRTLTAGEHDNPRAYSPLDESAIRRDRTTKARRFASPRIDIQPLLSQEIDLLEWQKRL